MKNLLKNLGVFTTTGMMAMLGMVTGMLVFRPDCVRFGNNETDNKESE